MLYDVSRFACMSALPNSLGRRLPNSVNQIEQTRVRSPGQSSSTQLAYSLVEINEYQLIIYTGDLFTSIFTSHDVNRFHSTECVQLYLELLMSFTW